MSTGPWGFSISGKLGYASTDHVGDNETPADAGDVMVRRWGRGNKGQLGYGDTENRGDDELPSTLGPVSL